MGANNYAIMSMSGPGNATVTCSDCAARVELRGTEPVSLPAGACRHASMYFESPLPMPATIKISAPPSPPPHFVIDYHRRNPKMSNPTQADLDALRRRVDALSTAADGNRNRIMALEEVVAERDRTRHAYETPAAERDKAIEERDEWCRKFEALRRERDEWKRKAEAAGDGDIAVAVQALKDAEARLRPGATGEVGRLSALAAQYRDERDEWRAEAQHPDCVLCEDSPAAEHWCRACAVAVSERSIAKAKAEGIAEVEALLSDMLAQRAGEVAPQLERAYRYVRDIRSAWWVKGAEGAAGERAAVEFMRVLARGYDVGGDGYTASVMSVAANRIERGDHLPEPPKPSADAESRPSVLVNDAGGALGHMPTCPCQECTDLKAEAAAEAEPAHDPGCDICASDTGAVASYCDDCERQDRADGIEAAEQRGLAEGRAKALKELPCGQCGSEGGTIACVYCQGKSVAKVHASGVTDGRRSERAAVVQYGEDEDTREDFDDRDAVVRFVAELRDGDHIPSAEADPPGPQGDAESDARHYSAGSICTPERCYCAEAEPVPECLCGVTGARHCAVHQEGEPVRGPKTAGGWREGDPICGECCAGGWLVTGHTEQPCAGCGGPVGDHGCVLAEAPAIDAEPVHDIIWAARQLEGCPARAVTHPDTDVVWHPGELYAFSREDLARTDWRLAEPSGPPVDATPEKG